tara:strand:- start:571 stop:927 length:357 start_codon:yes stop_codon:yes gene_type:complete
MVKNSIMGKISDYVITCEESEYLVHQAFDEFLNKCAVRKKVINQQILTEVLENNVDIDTAKYDWFETQFLEFLDTYVADVQTSNASESDYLFSKDLWTVNDHCHDSLYNQFAEILQNI